MGIDIYKIGNVICPKCFADGHKNQLGFNGQKWCCAVHGSLTIEELLRGSQDVMEEVEIEQKRQERTEELESIVSKVSMILRGA